MKKNILLLVLFLGLVLIFFLFFLKYQEGSKIKNSFIPVTPTAELIEKTEAFYPIAEFRQRITKKPFGTYITPETSPVRSERFSGWHTGVDIEYEDTKEDVPVWAMCSGEIALSRWVSGYGGVVVIKCEIKNNDYYILYGHLDPNRIMKTKKVNKNDQIGILGDGYSNETDNERKHLHFSIHKDTLDLRGYVQNQDELDEWIDPLSTDLFY